MYSYKGFKMPHNLPLLMSVLFLLLYYTVLLKLFPIQKVINIIAGKSSCPGEKIEITRAEAKVLDKIYRAASFFLKRILRSERPCLRRTLILYRWCCRRGIGSRVIIGVKKSEGTLQSHAWLEIGSLPFKEKPEHLCVYTPMLEG